MVKHSKCSYEIDEFNTLLFYYHPDCDNLGCILLFYLFLFFVMKNFNCWMIVGVGV